MPWRWPLGERQSRFGFARMRRRRRSLTKANRRKRSSYLLPTWLAPCKSKKPATGRCFDYCPIVISRPDRSAAQSRVTLKHRADDANRSYPPARNRQGACADALGTRAFVVEQGRSGFQNLLARVVQFLDQISLMPTKPQSCRDRQPSRRVRPCRRDHSMPRPGWRSRAA